MGATAEDVLKVIKDDVQPAIKAGQEAFEKRTKGIEETLESTRKATEDKLKAIEAAGAQSIKELRESIPAATRDKIFGGPAADQIRDARKKLNEKVRFMILNARNPKGVEAEARALGVDVGANGGFLVPSELASEIIVKAEKSAVFRPNATVMDNAPPKGSMGAEDGDVTLYEVVDNEAITESTPTFKNVEWGLATVAGLVRVSNHLMKWTPFDLSNWLGGRFGRALTRWEELRYMNGSGSGMPLGLRKASGVASVNQAGASMTVDDLISVEHALPIQYREDAVFIMHDDIFAIIKKLKDDQNRPLFYDANRPEVKALAMNYRNSRGMLNGYPVFLNNNIPTDLGAGSDESEIWFGPLSYYYIWTGGPMELASSDQADDAFKRNQTHVRMLYDTDGKLALGESFAYLAKAK